MPKPDPSACDADALIDAVIDREGRYVNHPADRGGPTCWGITEAVARAEGHVGAMRDLPRDMAASIYRRLYRSEEHTSELQSLMRISYAVFCLKKKTNRPITYLSNHTLISYYRPYTNRL